MNRQQQATLIALRAFRSATKPKKKDAAKFEAMLMRIDKARTLFPIFPFNEPTLGGYIARQSEWSRVPFGPELRTAGIIEHVRKELREVKAAPWDAEEWVDVAILALDGAQRIGRKAGLTAEQAGRFVAAIMEEKAEKNRRRKWAPYVPGVDRAIEHVRKGER